MLETNQGDYKVFEADPLKLNWLRLAQCYDLHDNLLYYRYDQQGLLTHIHDEHHDMLLSLHYLQPPCKNSPVYSPSGNVMLTRVDFWLVTNIINEVS